MYETAAQADARTDTAGTDRRIVGVQAAGQRFSDNRPTASSISVSPRAAGRVLVGTNQNSVSVTVLDQYGNPYRSGAAYTATSTGIAGTQYAHLDSTNAQASGFPGK